MRTILGLGLSVIFTLLTLQASYAQEDTSAPPVQNPPVIVEAAFSNNDLLFQAVIQKRFLSAPKFGVLAVSELLGKWDSDEQDGYMIQGNITYELFDGLSLMGGFHTASGIGIRPAFGVLYVYAKKDFFIMLNPRYYADNIANLEGFMMAEYKPEISDQWSFYARAQGVYNLTTSGWKHDISYIRLRAGFSYKEFAFGPAANIEFYGPNRKNVNSFGVFVNALLF